MKKAFNLTQKNYELWTILVNEVIECANILQFNILYRDQKQEDSIIKSIWRNGKINKSNPSKFYDTKEVVELAVSKNTIIEIKEIGNFSYWKNKSLEDPSFWLEDKEILACITHENMLMIDMDFIDESMLKEFGLVLYPL